MDNEQELPAYSVEEVETAKQCAQQMVDAGHFTIEQANERLAYEGYTAKITPPTAPTSELASDMARNFSSAQAHQYEMPPLVNHVSAYGKDEQAQDLQQRNWLSEGGFPREIGNTLAQEIKKTSESLTKMNQVQRDAWLDKQNKTLTAIWGDKQDEKIQLARQLVNEIEARQPGLKAFLDRTGSGNDANVISILANHAKIMSLKK